MTYAQHALTLTRDGRNLAASLFLPETVRRAVLAISPFAEERKGALPALVRTAREAAARGTAVLLLDFSGCGDSDGLFEEQAPETFDADAEAACNWLRRSFPATPLTLLGVRTGALLAQRLAACRPDVAALALWAPVSGSDFLRQLLQRRMVNDMVAFGKARESRAALEARLAAGDSVDLDGYTFSGTFYAWLQRLVPQPAAVPTWIASGGHDEKTAAACLGSESSGSRSALRFPPFWNTVGHVDLTPLVSETVDWLDAQPAAEASPAPAVHQTDAGVSPFVSIASTQTVRAVYDVPAGVPRAGLLLLHGWSGDRTGPHRLFAIFGRRMAAEGWLCLRPDFIGRGFSDGSAEEASIAGMTADARAALAQLRLRLPPGAPVAVAAICSGCKVAISLAADEPELDRLVLWSAESMGSLRSSATGLRKTVQTLLTYAKKLGRPETWKKILRGKVQTGMVTKALVRQEARSAEEAAAEDRTLKRFQRFRRPILFVFGGSDPDATGSRAAYDRYCKNHRIPHALHTIPHAGHSYYGADWTADLFAASERFLRLPSAEA